MKKIFGISLILAFIFIQSNNFVLAQALNCDSDSDEPCFAQAPESVCTIKKGEDGHCKRYGESKEKGPCKCVADVPKTETDPGRLDLE